IQRSRATRARCSITRPKTTSSNDFVPYQCIEALRRRRGIRVESAVGMRRGILGGVAFDRPGRAHDSRAQEEWQQNMATFVLVPAAGGVSWYWHRVVPLLEQAKHEAIPVDLPGDDARAGLSVYADHVLDAIGAREVILVAQSLGGFTAALVCARARLRMLAFV